MIPLRLYDKLSEKASLVDGIKSLMFPTATVSVPVG